tara:strand:+ start:326 stop:613 length:288 start_codon:yes stop_codon:yes gene_type:complete
MPFSFLFKNKKEHIIELYNPDCGNSLPKDGWIQQCKNCDMRTCQTFEFKRVETRKTIFIYMVYLCKACNRKNIIKNEEFINKLNKHIDLNYLLPS